MLLSHPPPLPSSTPSLPLILNKKARNQHLGHYNHCSSERMWGRGRKNPLIPSPTYPPRASPRVPVTHSFLMKAYLLMVSMTSLKRILEVSV